MGTNRQATLDLPPNLRAVDYISFNVMAMDALSGDMAEVHSLIVSLTGCSTRKWKCHLNDLYTCMCVFLSKMSLIS